ncbi:hypothetical protein NQZ68_012525 [Dissostichus eleginoides]|nr:hypothetical protein NQZ68_012525 [Dissostichus eleginoides]
MDSGDIHAATSRGDNKRRGNKKNRDWHKRPHLRNTVVQPPTMQSEDKRGPKKIAEGWEQSTVWPSSKKPPQEAQQGQHRINDNGNTLRFTCSQCKDNSEYVPKDLVKHFKKKKKKKEEEEVHPIAMKPNDPIPKMKSRLTRSAVREMCWLTQDCLSLPGKEFLDKYCHLSDPQTTLKETQQFLMKSVAGETGEQKWSKALKTVLSNVPQDINLYSKSENGIVSNASNLAILTAKNKMTVSQNGATNCKRLKIMTSLDKETHSPESAPDDAHRVVDQNGCQSNLSNQSPCPQTETKLNDMLPAQSEPSACGQMQENRENREIKTDQEMEDNSKKPEEPMHEDRNNISSELKSTNEGEEQTSIHKVLPNNKKQRRKRRARSKKVAKRSSGSALKIVLKKNPVKEKQWVTQSSLSPSGCGQMDGPPNTHVKLEGILQNTLLTEEHQQKLTKASESDPDDLSKAVTQNPQPKQGEELTPSCAAKTTRSKNTDGDTPVKLKGLPLMHQEMGHESDKPPEAEVDEGGAACETGLIAGTEVSPGNAQLNTSGSNTDCHVSAADGETPHSSSTQPSPVSQPVITAQGKVTHTDVSHAQHSVEGVRVSEAPADLLHPDLLSNSSSSEAILTEPSSPSGHQWLPKNQERTLKLVAMNPSQLVKRPAGDQPVVVLNHPDADIPEVTRIMEVLNRYRGEVQKVVLSRKTVSALAAANCEANAEPDPAWNAKNSVQERFVLKLKLRRLSRKKYEVVAAAAPSGNVRKEFRCWFCGRIFACQETWMVHRQRHLMDWKGPKLENS